MNLFGPKTQIKINIIVNVLVRTKRKDDTNKNNIGNKSQNDRRGKLKPMITVSVTLIAYILFYFKERRN